MTQLIINAYTLAFVILSIFVTAFYLVYIFRRKEALNLIPLFLSIATVILIYRLIGFPGSTNYYNVLALDLSLAIISTILAIFYISRPYIFITLIVLFIIGVVIYSNTYPGNTAFAGMFAIGTIYGLLYREFALSPRRDRERQKDRKKRKTEINRDYVHIVLGLVMLAILYFVVTATYAISIIFFLMLLGYTANNLLANLKAGPIYRKTLMDLERKNVTFGLGAMYLAASTALIIGFIANWHLLILAFVALFFADPLATIAGLSGRRHTELPYNKHKTIIGTAVFLIVTAVAGAYLLGLYGVLFAAILAFVEGLNLSLDDNLRTGIVAVILGALL